jgi:drug/metabolite transporter (DMT)-like permease
MIFIILAVLCSTAVSQILKLSERMRYPIGSVFLLNYLVASLFASIQADYSTYPMMDSVRGIFFYGTAVLLGLLFIGSFYIYRKTLGEMGVSPATTISRLSTGLPMIGSLIFFREYPSLKQALGMVLMVIAIPLASKRERNRKNFQPSPWGILLFFAFGINDFILKIVKEMWPKVDENAFLLIVFAIAGLTAQALMILKKEPIALKAIFPGIILGLVNLGSALFVMKALNSLPAIIVYPTLSLGIILLGIITGLLFWREKMTLAYGLFLLIAITSIVLIT